MLSRTKRIMICVLAAFMLISVISAAGLMALGKNKVYTGVASQPYINDTAQSEDSLQKASTQDTASSGTLEIAAATGSTEKANNVNTDKSTGTKSVKAPVTQTSSGKMTLRDIIRSKGLTSGQLKIRLFVDKSDKLLIVYNGNIPLKSYHVELGDSGSGDKVYSGDHKTPEGSFYITEKMVLSPADQYLGTRWMRLSYPNIEDAQRGLDSGLISKVTYNEIVSAINNGQTPPQDTALGGGVGVHGGSTADLGTNWTYGCVGLSNSDVQDFYSYVKVGTRVTIQQ